MGRYFNFVLLFFLISCSPTNIKLVDDYYIYILLMITMLHII